MLISCHNTTSYSIEKGRVGKVSKKTKVKDLKQLFAKDSLVVRLSEQKETTGVKKYFKNDDEYLVYEKGGKHLLTLVPISQHDSLSTIKSVEIFDGRYKTKKGITLFSPYKDIHSAYAINVTNTISSAHLDIDELNATMLIDKKEIGINRFNRDKIRPDNIPDLAKIKHFTMWFN